MSTPSAPNPTPASPGWALLLAQHRPRLAQALFALAALAAALPVTLAIVERGNTFGPVFFFGCALSLGFFAAGLAAMSHHPQDEPAHHVRILLMVLLGYAGFCCTILGFVLPVTTFRGKLTGGLDNWNANRGSLALVALSIFGGLSLMFLALLLVRGLERGNQTIRWLVYGFNALFSTVLLASILFLVNVLVYAEPVDQAFGRVFSREYDWTETQMYTLNPKTESFLGGLEEKVKVYVLLPGQDVIARDTQTLLRNFQARNSKVHWEMLSPLVAENRVRIEGMERRYAFSGFGLLVLAGDEKGKHDHQFIPLRKLYEQGERGPAGQPGRRKFAGENALLGTLTSLVEGKVVVYFTQGHGELDIAFAAAAGRDPAGSASTLRERLVGSRNRFEAKPLRLDRGGAKVPDDASTVVILRPTRPFSEAATKTLGDYLSRKPSRDKDGKSMVAPGRLMILVGPTLRREGGVTSLVKTGLEEFLAARGVKLGDNRVESLQKATDPTYVLTVANRESPSSLGKAFFRSGEDFDIIPLENARTVEPMAARTGPAQGVDALLLAPAQFGVWTETDFGRDPVAVAQRLKTDRKELARVLSRRELTLGVTVTEPAAMPRDAQHAAARPPQGRPLMVVIGSGGWVSDAVMAGPSADTRFDVFSSCLSWLREQSDIGKFVPVKESPHYALRIPEAQHNLLRFLPLGLMLLAVTGLGIGVWVVRRR